MVYSENLVHTYDACIIKIEIVMFYNFSRISFNIFVFLMIYFSDNIRTIYMFCKSPSVTYF